MQQSGKLYRDGSFEYYANEPIISNDLHRVGVLLLAAVELENLREVKE
jgi:hypothetical protein